MHASTSGWQYPVTYGEALTLVLLTGYLKVHRAPNAPPVQLPAPWDAAGPIFTEAEIAAAEAILESRIIIAREE